MEPAITRAGWYGPLAKGTKKTQNQLHLNDKGVGSAFFMALAKTDLGGS